MKYFIIVYTFEKLSCPITDSVITERIFRFVYTSSLLDHQKSISLKTYSILSVLFSNLRVDRSIRQLGLRLPLLPEFHSLILFCFQFCICIAPLYRIYFTERCGCLRKLEPVARCSTTNCKRIRIWFVASQLAVGSRRRLRQASSSGRRQVGAATTATWQRVRCRRLLPASLPVWERVWESECVCASVTCAREQVEGRAQMSPSPFHLREANPTLEETNRFDLLANGSLFCLFWPSDWLWLCLASTFWKLLNNSREREQTEIAEQPIKV